MGSSFCDSSATLKTLTTALKTKYNMKQKKLKKTGLLVPIKDGGLLLDTLMPTLVENYNVTLLFSRSLEKNKYEIYLTSTLGAKPQYKYATMLIKNSIKFLDYVQKKSKEECAQFESITDKIVSLFKSKLKEHVTKDNLQSVSDSLIVKKNSDYQKPILYDENEQALQLRHPGIKEIIYLPKSKVGQLESKETQADRWVDVGSNASPGCSSLKEGLRPVVIDGCNVAFSHGKHIKFSFEGLLIAINFFKDRGHKVIAVLPNHRKGFVYKYILKEWEIDGTLVFTPSRWIQRLNVVCEDDRFILQTAASLGGVVVSLDQYRNYLGENPEIDDTILNRLLMFTWVEDQIIFPEDPLGPNGPNLDQFLRF